MRDKNATPMSDSRRWTAHLPVVGFATSIVGAFAMVILTLFKAPSPFEAGLLQIVILLTGLWGSYIIGRNSAVEAAREMIRPHVRSAFRRAANLYASLYRLSARIDRLNQDNPDPRLDLVQALVAEQYATGRDALDDWRDIVPEEVGDLESLYKRRYADNDNSN